MLNRHPLDILFLTNYSDYCYRAIPAVAELADSLKSRLTIMHAYNPRRMSRDEAETKLHSFFPEADRFPACRREAVAKPLIPAVQRHLDFWPVNLIVAPASDPIGLPRIGDRSIRARLIESCGVPVWTMGRGADFGRIAQPVRNVACWLDFHSGQTGHLAYAIDFAVKTGAKLHLLRGLPEVHEGSLAAAAYGTEPMHPDSVREEILRLCPGSPVKPEIHVGTGEGRRAVARMARECGAGVIFLRKETSWLPKWMGMGLRVGDAAPCPAIYVPDRTSVPAWNLEPGRARSAMTPRLPVRQLAARAGG